MVVLSLVVEQEYSGGVRDGSGGGVSEVEVVEVERAGATLTPAYLVEHTGWGIRCQIAGTRALRLRAAAWWALSVIRRVLVEEEGGWWNRGYRGADG